MLGLRASVSLYRIFQLEAENCYLYISSRCEITYIFIIHRCNTEEITYGEYIVKASKLMDRLTSVLYVFDLYI